MEGADRIFDIARDSGIAIILLFCFALITFAISIGGIYTFASATRLLSIRDRSSIFIKTTIFDDKINLVLFFQFALSLSVLLVLYGVNNHDLAINTNRLGLYTLATAVIVSIFLFIWLKLLEFVGRLFFSGNEVKQWIKNFITMTGGVGVVLFAVLLIAIYVRTASSYALTAGFVLLLLFKIATVCKGIRLFFGNFYSLLYLILYLCTLEMIPLLLLHKSILYLFGLKIS